MSGTLFDQSSSYAKNPISDLQETCIRCGLPPPLYNELESTGPPHSRTFRISVSVGNEIAEGSGFTKKQAKSDAASRMVSRLNVLPSARPVSSSPAVLPETENSVRVPSTSPHGIVKPVQRIMPFSPPVITAPSPSKLKNDFPQIQQTFNEMNPLDLTRPPGLPSFISPPQNDVLHCYAMQLDPSYKPNGFQPSCFPPGLDNGIFSSRTSNCAVSDSSHQQINSIDSHPGSSTPPALTIDLPQRHEFTPAPNQSFPAYDPSGEMRSKNPVSQLQELCAKHGFKLPVYIDKDSDGPSHNRIFTVQVTAAQLTGYGVATTKKEAKRKAAEQALAAVEEIMRTLTQKSSR